MSVACPVCDQFHDHNIMEHIYQLENHVHALLERIVALEREATKSQQPSKSSGEHTYNPDGYCYNCGQNYVNTTTFCPKGKP